MKTRAGWKQITYALAGLGLAVCIFCMGGNTIVSRADTQITMNTNANVRSEASTDASVVARVASGATLSVTGETTGADGQVWYQVSVNGATGYVRSDLASAGGGMTQEQAEQINSTTNTAATVSETDVTAGTVSTNAKVRKGPSTTDAVVGNVKSGSQVAITGETTGADGNKWWQVEVDGKTGFIRSDLVDEEEPAAPEEGGEEGAESEDGEAYPEEGGEAAPVTEGGPEIASVISSVNLPADVDLEDMTIDEETLKEWESGELYLLRVEDENEEDAEAWYLYSVPRERFEKVEIVREGESAASSPMGGSEKLLLIVGGVLIVVLLVICILLALKVREYREYGYGDDEDDEDDDEEEDDEDDEDEEEEEDDEDDEDDDGPVRKRRWSPRNFLSRRDEDDEEEEDDEDDGDDDEEEDDDEDEVYLEDDDFEFEFLNMDGKDRRK